MSANYLPNLNTYTDLKPFRFWCQKVLPLAYDDSLSYYELLNKVVDYLNKTMEDVTLSIEDVQKLHTAYEQLETYVNDYFDNLDVQEEINTKLDSLVEDGTIHDIFNPDVEAILSVANQAASDAIEAIPSNVTAWLDTHVTPETEILLDESLTIEGAAADAKAAGDQIRALKSDLNNLSVAAGIDTSTSRTEVLSLTYTSGYVGTGGVPVTPSATLQYSNSIAVNPGDVLSTDHSYFFRFVAAFDGDGQAVTEKGTQNVDDYTVPDGIASVIITIPQAYSGNITKTTISNVYTRKPWGNFTARGNMANGDSLTLSSVYSRANKNVRQFFYGNITQFTKLLVGRKNGNSGKWVEIDDTNITVYSDNVAGQSVAHGLTIANNIAVEIVTKSDGTDNPLVLYNADITIMSNGSTYTLANINWVRTFDFVFAQSVGSALTDCVLTWTVGDLNKKIFAFGDSYFSWYAARWVYYMAKDGFANNLLTDAYAGQTSAAAVPAMQCIVPCGEPKYLLWCLGMNDGSDSSSAPSEAWAAGRDAVINICAEYGITPIFATIPTVPTINHEQKNAWIRSSGYRYIDFAKAVGAQADGTWFNGMCADGVHPTEEGAKALYSRALVDFPEITISN